MMIHTVGMYSFGNLLVVYEMSRQVLPTALKNLKREKGFVGNEVVEK